MVQLNILKYLNTHFSLFIMITLAFMEKALKTSVLLFIAIGLVVYVTNGTFMNHVPSHAYTECESSNDDTSNHLNDSHSVNFEDETLLSDTQFRPSEFTCGILLLSFTTENYKTNFSYSIWQPPKRS